MNLKLILYIYVQYYWKYMFNFFSRIFCNICYLVYMECARETFVDMIYISLPIHTCLGW